MFDGLVGRLPIYNKKLGVFGYELNFCSGSAMRLDQPDEPEQWADTVLQAGQELTLAELTGGGRALIRVPPSALPICEELRWPKSQIVLGIPSEILADSVLEATANRLARSGYTIALHDRAFHADILAQAGRFVSFYAVDAHALADGAPPLSGRRESPSQWLVRDIETPDQFDRSTQLDFDLYEGRFFQSPRSERSTEIPANRLALLEMLTRLQDPSTTINELEVLIKRDVTLSYKLLRLINSAFYGGGKPVTSVQRAVMFFGLQRVKNWAAVILINALDYLPKELLVTATVRARACEQLAVALQRDGVETYYLTGLFSLLDAIMDVPKETIVNQLNLAPEIRSALMAGEGPVGEVLNGALAFEQAAELPVPLRTLDLGLPMKLYLEAIRWGTDIRRIVSEG